MRRRFRIHEAPFHIRELFKQHVNWYIPGHDVLNLPNVTGIGIGLDHVKVTISRGHPAHDVIPTELTNGIPVILEEQPERSHHARGGGKGGGRGGGGGGSCDAGGALPASKVAGPLQGGMPLVCGDTAFGILKGSRTGASFIVGAAHSFAYLQGGTVTYNGQTIGTFKQTALTCGSANNHLDASIASVAAGVQTTGTILGLGAPKGFAQPVVGTRAHMQGAYGGARTGTVTTINYSYKDDYGGEGNLGKSCPVTHQDQFQVANKSGIDGDSGAAVWNDAGFVTGLHFDGDSAGNLGTNCKAIYMTPELGITV